MQLNKRNLVFLLLAVWGFFALCPRLAADNITMLPLVNPGFDTGESGGGVLNLRC